jgi:signal transduction histidine kinase
MTGTRLKKLLLGNQPFIPSHAEYKRVVLTGQLSLLTLIVCVVFVTLDLVLHRYHALFLHISCTLASVAGLMLNRAGKHFASKIVLALSTNITVYLFATSEPFEIGLYLFFIAINLGTVAVFGYVQRRIAFVFICFSVFLFMMFLLSDFSPFDRAGGDETYIKFNIFVNFIISLVACTVIIVFLINLNFRSEEALKANEKEMIQKNEELTKLNTELDRFMYSTSHDLRSPISSVLGLIQLAKMTNDPNEIRTYMEMMEERLASLNKFIKDISEYSRNARTEIDKQQVKVHKVIHEIVETLKFYPGAEKMKVSIDVDPHFEIATDPTRLQLILSNLISNSFKYVDPYKESPFIKVSAHMNSTHVHFKIEDNGLGIPEAFLPKIFDMFFQAHENSEGSGLGLYIVKEAVAKLNGTIGAKSKLQEGSQFEVRLPA